MVPPLVVRGIFYQALSTAITTLNSDLQALTIHPYQ